MKIIFDIIVPFGISFICSVLLSPVVIRILIKLRAFQSIRKEGVEGHLSKIGTPTMGGIIILAAAIMGCITQLSVSPDLKVLILVSVGFGGIGFIDDYLKIVKKNSKGLSPLKKFTAQIILIAFFIMYLNKNGYDFCTYKIPFFENLYLTLPAVISVIIDFVAFAGTVNGVNFTDGIDGLAGSVTFLVLIFLVVTAALTGNIIISVLCAFSGAVIGFLFFNCYPAKIFMGDTGSLALGGLVAASAFLLKIPLLLSVVGIVYLIEVLSVIIQVSYFKITHGKRIFKMAPIHHHFELCGFDETQIVVLFSILTAIACVIALKGV